MIGLAEQEIATQQTHNEIHLNVEIISAIETMLAVSMACSNTPPSLSPLHPLPIEAMLAVSMVTCSFGC